MTEEEIAAAISRLGGWVPHSGGECPIQHKRSVELKLRDGRVVGPMPSNSFTWSWKAVIREGLNVMAYRIIK